QARVAIPHAGRGGRRLITGLAPARTTTTYFQSPDFLPAAQRRRLWATPILALLASPPLRVGLHHFAIRRGPRLFSSAAGRRFPVFHNAKTVLARFARGIIRRKVRLLVSRAGFTKQDRQDLEQELVLRLLQSLDLFDPEQAHPNVFITTVIERAVAMILRERR